MLSKPLARYSDKEVAERIKEDFQAAEAELDTLFERAWLCNKMFHCKDPDEALSVQPMLDNGRYARYSEASDPEQTNYNRAYLPWGRGVILTAESILHNAIFPDHDNFLRFDPRDPDEEHAVNKMEDSVKFFMDEARYVREALVGMRQALKYPFSLLYLGWEVRGDYLPIVLEDYFPMWDFVNGGWVDGYKTGERRVQYKYVPDAINRPGVWAVNTFNARIDPTTDHRGLERCGFVGMTYMMSKREMRQKAQTGFFDKAVIAKIKDDEPINYGGGADQTKDFDARLRSETGEKWTPWEYINKNFVRVDQYHDGTGHAYMINGNPEYMARKANEPGYPFSIVRTFTEEGKFHGHGLAEYLLSIQFDLNLMYRLERTQQDRAVNPDPIIDLSYFENMREVYEHGHTPGTPWIVDGNVSMRDPRLAVTYVDVPSNRAPDMQYSKSLALQMGERSSGVSDNAQSTSRSARTATEALAMQQGMGQRFDSIRKNMEDGLLLTPVYIWIRLIHVNLNRSMLVKVSGRGGAEWLRVTPSDLAFTTSPKIKATGVSSAAAKEAGALAIQQALAFVTANPIYAPLIKQVPSLRRFLTAFGLDPDELIEDPGSAVSAIDQGLENVLLAKGIDVPINPADDHEEHLRKIAEFVESAEFELVPKEYRSNFLKHGQLHNQALAMLKSGVSPVTDVPNGAGGMPTMNTAPAVPNAGMAQNPGSALPQPSAGGGPVPGSSPGVVPQTPARGGGGQ